MPIAISHLVVIGRIAIRENMEPNLNHMPFVNLNEYRFQPKVFLIHWQITTSQGEITKITIK